VVLLTNTKNSNINSAVVDNNILVDLFELKRLDILFKVFDKVTIPRVIYDMEILKEVMKELDEFEYKVSDLENDIGYTTYYELTNSKKFNKLSNPDKMAISIAKQYTYYCNSNDGLVRKACNELEIEYIGILGVLGKAYEINYITLDELKKLCNLLGSNKTTCYIRRSLIDDFLKNIAIDNI
jgi:predicted nucleic acid-binding protein